MPNPSTRDKEVDFSHYFDPKDNTPSNGASPKLSPKRRNFTRKQIIFGGIIVVLAIILTGFIIQNEIYTKPLPPSSDRLPLPPELQPKLNK